MGVFTVKNNDSSGPDSLREAILAANTDVDPDSTINFDFDPPIPTPVTITLETALPNITKNLTINGLGANNLIIERDDTQGDFRIFTIANGNKVTIKDLTVKNGREGDGGAISVTNNSELTLEGLIITENKATNGGGGIYADNSTINISNTEIYENEAEIFGGGIYFNNVISSHISNTEIYRNKALINHGGGIFSTGSTILNISNDTKIYENEANSNGGGVYVAGGNLDIINTEINENNATDGGGLYTTGSTINISNTKIYENEANFYGGGVYVVSGKLDIIDTEINKNISVGGGGFLISNSDVSITDCHINDNRADSYGGIYNSAFTYTTKIERTTISGNFATAAISGVTVGGILHNSGTLEIRYSTINNNQGSVEANNILNGSFAVQNDINITNSTITEGQTNNIPSVLLSNATSKITMKNVTMHRNGPTDYETIHNNGVLEIGNTIIDRITGEGTVTNLGGGTGGNFITSDETDDPQLGSLSDNGGPTLTMKPLSYTSPLVNKGLLANVDSITDQRGEGYPREIDGQVDIGAIEANFAPICYSGDSMILAENIETGEIAEVAAKNIVKGIHRVYDVKSKKFVDVKYNIVTGPARRFMKITKGALGENMPSETFYVTSGHRLLVNGEIIKARKLSQAKRVKVKPQMVYSICTELETINIVNGLTVLAWGRKEWLAYNKIRRIDWRNNGEEERGLYTKRQEE